jgi:hypothetical protein
VSGLSANKTLTLPTPPSSNTSFLQIDTSGNITAGAAVSGGLTTSNLSSSAGITGGQIANTTITAANIANATLTNAQISTAAAIATTKLGLSNVGSSGTVTNTVTAGSLTLVSGLSVSTSSMTSGTVSGRPVMIYLQGAAGGANSFINTGSSTGTIAISRDLLSAGGTNIYQTSWVGQLPPSVITCVDTSGATGSHTWYVYAVGSSVTFNNVVMTVVEVV